jgi:uncharacterized protein (TIGR02466 family)
MQYTNIFTTFLAMDQLSLDNESIVNFCRKNLITEKNRMSDHQSWIRQEDVNGSIKELFDHVENKFNEAYKQYGFSDEYVLKIREAWCTINNCYATSKPHTHPTSFFSAVYYPVGKKEFGTIEFVTPNAASMHSYNNELISNYNEFNSSTFTVSPNAGTLLIFPSWLIHYVNENRSDEDRLSIALNCHYVKRDI